jgi:hypothetical protein
VGQGLSGLGAGADLNGFLGDRDDRGRHPGRSGDHALPAILDGRDATVHQSQVRLVVQAVHALDYGFVKFVDGLSALCGVGIDLVDALDVQLDFEAA